MPLKCQAEGHPCSTLCINAAFRKDRQMLEKRHVVGVSLPALHETLLWHMLLLPPGG